MNKKLIGITGSISLVVILAACSQPAQSDALSPGNGEGQVVQAAQSSVTTPAVETDEARDTVEKAEQAATAETSAETALSTDTVESSLSEAEAPTTAQRSTVPLEIPQPKTQPIDGEYRWSQLLGRDSIAPIYEPQFAPANRAPYEDNELVIGVELNGEAKAYAIGPLNRREMVNDVVGGVPVLVTW